MPRSRIPFALSAALALAGSGGGCASSQAPSVAQITSSPAATAPAATAPVATAPAATAPAATAPAATAPSRPPIEDRLVPIDGCTYGQADAQLVAALDEASRATPLADRWITRSVEVAGRTVAAITIVETAPDQAHRFETPHVFLDGWVRRATSLGTDPRRTIVGPEQVLVVADPRGTRQLGWFHAGAGFAITEVVGVDAQATDDLVEAIIEAQHDGASPTAADLRALEGELAGEIVPVEGFEYVVPTPAESFDLYRDSYASSPPGPSDFRGVEHYVARYVERDGLIRGMVIVSQESMGIDPSVYLDGMSSILGAPVVAIGGTRMARGPGIAVWVREDRYYSVSGGLGDFPTDAFLLALVTGPRPI